MNEKQVRMAAAIRRVRARLDEADAAVRCLDPEREPTAFAAEVFAALQRTFLAVGTALQTLGAIQPDGGAPPMIRKPEA
jgi:hypothetical protein